MIKGAIFDFDGTLFDSMYIWATMGETYLRSIGLEPRENLNEKFKTLSLYTAALYYQTEYGVTLSVQEIMNGINSLAEIHYREKVIPKPGIPQFLADLKEKGVRMCIATASDKYLIEAALQRCGISQYFSEIFTCTSVGHGKDEPVIYRKALEHLGTKKCETVVFEDSLHAVKTAKNDGFTVSAVFDTYEKEQDAVKRLSDFYITDFSDLHDFWKFASN